MKKTESIYISKDREFIIGEKALEKIQIKNDKRYFDPEKGVVAVDKNRWKEAQAFEFNTWLKDGLKAKDDSNELYKKHFDNYFHLKGKRFKKAIELGAGPFTNARLIAKVAKIDEISLLDPLINDYLNHPNCTYKNKRLKIKTGFSMLSKRIPVKLYSCPIEEFLEEKDFDLIIIINVIEHCFDLKKVFDKIIEISKPGTFFVFYDKYFSKEELEDKINKWYDSGHPLRVQGKLLQEFLDKNFITLLSKITYFKIFKRGLDLSQYGFFYIGYRK